MNIPRAKLDIRETENSLRDTFKAGFTTLMMKGVMIPDIMDIMIISLRSCFLMFMPSPEEL